MKWLAPIQIITLSAVLSTEAMCTVFISQTSVVIWTTEATYRKVAQHTWHITTMTHRARCDLFYMAYTTRCIWYKEYLKEILPCALSCCAVCIYLFWGSRRQNWHLASTVVAVYHPSGSGMISQCGWWRSQSLCCDWMLYIVWASNWMHTMPSLPQQLWIIDGWH